MNSRTKTFNLLWTGGWDSTFQLLRLVFCSQVDIQPYYLIDEDRRSTRFELVTMRNIRAAIARTDESAAKRIRPTILATVSEVPACLSITDAFNRIRGRRFIGSQYDWLARFCKARDVRNLQLCIHRDDKAAKAIEHVIVRHDSDVPYVQPPVDKNMAYEHLVFGRFEFPVLDLTKRDMLEASIEHGWLPVMETTWFCHSPRAGKPCGRCNPCVYTAEEGLSWRVPMSRQISGRVYNYTVKPVREFLRARVRQIAGL